MHPIKEILLDRDSGKKCGIASYCSANKVVIRTALMRAKRFNRPTLIEATANQVNQYGGYTGMVPAQFYHMVMALADELGVDRKLVILGGDHLGPLVWSGQPEVDAMAKAEKLVYEYVRAGFTKIHLDTSMKLADDADGALSPYIVARRGVQLYKKAMAAYEALKRERPDAMRPVFVIGSEVPIPGGAQEEEEHLSVTSPAALEETYHAYCTSFSQQGFPDAMEDVVAIVVQPGVEFGDNQVFLYDREKAAALCASLKKYPGLCLEGHSTDYQGRQQLREMCEDGIAILKVGPALTFGLRESYFSLCQIERELVPKEEQSYFIEVLESVMVEEPKEWINHYHGTERQKGIARKYSLSDRSRYYMNSARIEAAIDKLISNLRKYEIPMGMLHQYMPDALARIRAGKMSADPEALAIYGVEKYMEDYEYATL